MRFFDAALFDGVPHFFERDDHKYQPGPADHLRAGGLRSENTHFWSAMELVFNDMGEPASEIIAKHGIVDNEQQDEIRYCAALIRLRQGKPLDKAISDHNIVSDRIKGVLRDEEEALSVLQEKCVLVRDALSGAYRGDHMGVECKLRHVEDGEQKATLERHAIMLRLRRGGPPCEIIEHCEVKIESTKRTLFREAVRMEIEKGHAAPDAISRMGMTNEEDRALMRLIAASEDIGEGMPIDDAARRNEVPDDQVERLKSFRDALKTWRCQGGKSKRKREIDDADDPPAAKRRQTMPSSGEDWSMKIKRLGSKSLPIDVDYVLDEKDRLVPEFFLPSSLLWATVPRLPISQQGRGTSRDPIDLTKPSASSPPRRGNIADRPRERSNTIELD